ncbi:MAG: sulfatase-like hydrolase/transferase [Sphingomonadales bacterium]|nr:sulfatase-like hydrolase/transferase [Sphingomonadales bacterium]
MFAALAVSERSLDRLFFAAAALCSLVGVLLLIVADLERAMLLAAILATTIIGASKIKLHHSGIKLTAADFALAFAGTVPFLVVQYRRTAVGVLAGSMALLFAALATFVQAGGPPLPLDFRALFFAVAIGACALAYRVSGASESFQLTLTQGSCFFSTFMASVIDVRSWWPSRGLGLRGMTKEPLPLMTAIPARHAGTPDIILIQHESIFNPRLFGLAVESNIEAFLSPANGRSGRLNVDIYGGGSWQSEFSLVTGLSSAAFGSDAYFVFQKGVDRFHHTLPRALTALGYKTMLTSSCRRSFLNYDAFYRSIGVEERIFSDDFPPPFDVDRFEETSSDAVFLEAALGAFAEGAASDPAPRFLYALTNFNHGPHHRRLVPPGQFEPERAFAAANLADPQYVEYYTRLAETAEAWRLVKAKARHAVPEPLNADRTLRRSPACHDEAHREAPQASRGWAALLPNILCHRGCEFRD